MTANASVTLSTDELILRLFLPMVAAAADVLARRVVLSVDEVRIALVDGLGFETDKRDLIAWGASLPLPALESWLERLSLGNQRESIGALLRS